MKPIITKFNTSTGDTEIMIAVPYRDPWESHINQPMPAYEEKERYNIFCLIKENKELKKQLEYLRSGEYLNQLKFERNMLEDVVNKGEVSKEDKDFIDMTHRNTELLEENRELKKQLEEMDSKLFFTKNELEMRQKTIDNKLRQQKEFIEWLEKEIEALEFCDNEFILSNHKKEVKAYKEILLKYKEIIGKDINVSTREIKNDNWWSKRITWLYNAK